MNELITGLNGGNVPALDIIMLLTFAALLPSIVVMMSSFMRIISYFLLREMQWESSRHRLIWY